MKLTKAQKLINLFKASGLEESEQIQLDNLDEAKLVYSDKEEGKVMVENEHGTLFEVDELSKEEINIFDSVLPVLKTVAKQANGKPARAFVKKKVEVLRPIEPNKKQRALIQALIMQIEDDLKDRDYEALDELFCCLLRKKANENAMLNYLGDDTRELMIEGKLPFKY